MKWLGFTLCMSVTVFFGCGNPTDSNEGGTTPTERYIEIDVDDLPDTLVYFGEYEVSFSTNQPHVWYDDGTSLIPIDKEIDGSGLPWALWHQNDKKANFILNYRSDYSDTIIGGGTGSFSLSAGTYYKGYTTKTNDECIESNGKEITYHNPFYIEEIYRDSLCFKSVIKIDEQFKDKYAQKTETVVVWRTPLNPWKVYSNQKKHTLDDTLTILFEDLVDPTWHDERYHVDVYLLPHLYPDVVDTISYYSYSYKERLGSRNTLPIGYPLKN